MISPGPMEVLAMAAGARRFHGGVSAQLSQHAVSVTIRVLQAVLLLEDHEENGSSPDPQDLPREDVLPPEEHTAPPPAPQADLNTVIMELARLGALKTHGQLTEGEFDAWRAKLLGIWHSESST